MSLQAVKNGGSFSFLGTVSPSSLLFARAANRFFANSAFPPLLSEIFGLLLPEPPPGGGVILASKSSFRRGLEMLSSGTTN